MADITDTLKSLLGDDAEDKIKNVMGSLSAADNSKSDVPSIPSGLNTDSLGQLMQLRNVIEGITMNRSDPRTNLLMSLKPYMRDSRQKSLDSAVRLMGMVNLIKLIGK